MPRQEVSLPVEADARVSMADSTIESLTPAAFARHVDRLVDPTGERVAESWRPVVAALAERHDEAAFPARVLADLTGGKFLRSRLAVAGYAGLGGEDDAVAASLAVSVQLLHLGLCVHDDLIDGDAVRHGRPNVAGLSRQRVLAEGGSAGRAGREGMAAAVLAGDLAIAQSQRELLTAPLEPTVTVAVMAELLDALAVTIGGEWLDVRSEVAPPADIPADVIASLKTARYTTVLPLRLGAVAAGADALAVTALTGFGEYLGVAYQMKDDELGVFGDPGVTGKSVTADLRSGKRTGLLRLTYEHSTSSQRERLDELVGQESMGAAEASTLRQVILASGAADEHRARMLTTVERALGFLEPASGLPAPLVAYLTAAAATVVPRSS
ncbi:geranylgeranyl diphosphate synthase type I [Microbacteriaceae bacterium SG_E_30_P1]|uniref:Geranylgeranyl diphosphate synthase type I n=2 Tax=Antiquaquibacter oligotrophicus TaxID=2880260 RepID=A0ABT6KMH3_9MICO|nr:geranylgeranyl diphosphate synthase type I [Antiquaquibacter oligotrophicus]